jgi:hypothetical protein
MRYISMALVFNDPLHWAECAEDARRLAEQITNMHDRARMLGLAEQYERLVNRAVERLKHGAGAEVPRRSAP